MPQTSPRTAGCGRWRALSPWSAGPAVRAQASPGLPSAPFSRRHRVPRRHSPLVRSQQKQTARLLCPGAGDSSTNKTEIPGLPQLTFQASAVRWHIGRWRNVLGIRCTVGEHHRLEMCLSRRGAELSFYLLLIYFDVPPVAQGLPAAGRGADRVRENSQQEQVSTESSFPDPLPVSQNLPGASAGTGGFALITADGLQQSPAS